jgi:uncharacterized protein
MGGMDTSFDNLEIERPELAASYLQLLLAQPGRPIALFAPRRVGKTFFLDHDLTPAAQAQDFVPVYADVWLNKRSPLDAINHALEEALDDVHVPTSRTGKLAKTTIKKMGALGASVEFGDEPARRALPTDPALRLDALVMRLAQDSGKRVLLMLDEIQSLGELASGNDVVASLRAVLQKRKQNVFAVFTGSSQESLSAMMSAAGGPMYQFAQLLDFPVLGEDYVTLLATHFSNVHPHKQLDTTALLRVFAYLGYKPALFKDLLKAMSADGMTDIDLALARMQLDERHVAGWRALMEGLSPLELAVLKLIAKESASPLSQEALSLLQAQNKSVPITIGKIRTALDKLKLRGIVTKPLGRFSVDDRLFSQYIANLTSS